MTTLTVDEVLTTTRAVRRRMDPSRPVDLDTVIECLDIAVQAPSGGNIQRVRWMVVTDPGIRASLALLYREAIAIAMGEQRQPATDKVRSAARHLGDILQDVPVLVLVYGVGAPPPNPYRVPGFYGSIIPAIWNFQLALRSRGLGSVYTSSLNRRDSEVSALLGVPDDMTQVAMIPVGHTIGTDFRPAPRPPIEEIAFFDHWGAARRHRARPPGTGARSSTIPETMEE
ncbi:nitroreductase family protein [Salinibacterium sp. ZJ454]|uniref:nitroreductase family protein n=1 Tax=Salinibacterium sp. ZJ454 TaxID=2708339 RepID=UPI00141DDCD8|nr:nitroreductase family protein [Salinibacterium sp. ZJ454]